MSSEFLERRFREFENLSPNEVADIANEHRNLEELLPEKLRSIDEMLVWISHVYRCFPCAIENSERMERRYGTYF
jgi:hypothetical protein